MDITEQLAKAVAAIDQAETKLSDDAPAQGFRAQAPWTALAWVACGLGRAIVVAIADAIPESPPA